MKGEASKGRSRKPGGDGSAKTKKKNKQQKAPKTKRKRSDVPEPTDTNTPGPTKQKRASKQKQSQQKAEPHERPPPKEDTDGNEEGADPSPANRDAATDAPTKSKRRTYEWGNYGGYYGYRLGDVSSHPASDDSARDSFRLNEFPCECHPGAAGVRK
eukprot:scaffold6703_cov296-Prasinococcus_capsulatus_cf.AAC.2